MSILLAGAAGQLGRELHPLLADLGAVTPVDRHDPGHAHHWITRDLSDLSQVEYLLDATNPEIIVNAAAYTAVDAAEAERAAAFLLNAELPGCLARWARRNDRLLVHYSTDYVFDGDATRPYRESDSPRPLNVYGESKRAGEEAVAAAECRNIVLRTSWVYSTHGQNFLLTMLKLAAERDELGIVDDQQGRPTWAHNLARVSRRMIELATSADAVRPVDGLYHYCDADALSWCGFARAIFEAACEAGLLARPPAVNPIESTQFAQKATRPAYSVLDTSRIENVLGCKPVGLKESLARCMKELTYEQ